MTKKEIQDLKKEHGSLKVIKVDGKEIVLRQPQIHEYALYQSRLEKESYVDAVYDLAETLAVYGKEHLKDNNIFLNVMVKVVDSIDIVYGDIKEVDGQYHYTTTDGKKAIFRGMNRKDLSQYQMFHRQNNNMVRAGQNLGDNLFVEGDKVIIQQTKYVLGVYLLLPFMYKNLDVSLGKL